MITWNAAYGRLIKTQEFKTYFGSRIKMSDFRSLTFAQKFVGIATVAATAFGPTPATFPAGAIILGITAAGQQAPYGTTTGAAAGNPSGLSLTSAYGLRSQFQLNFQYSGNEVITPGGPISAEALMGNGQDTIFPTREWIIPPSQAILVNGTTLAQGPNATVMNIDIGYHCMVPRAVG